MFPNLRAEMARRNITGKQLCDEVGFSYETYKAKMRGTYEFKLNEMLAIKNLFTGCTIDYLFEQEGGDDVQVNQAPV